MAAPVLTAPQLPTGLVEIDPHGTLITFASAPTAPLWIKAITPFGYEGGEHIDIGNMHNASVTTKAPQSIIDITNATMRVAYDASQLGTLFGLINQPDNITFMASSRNAMAVWGYMKSFVPEEVVKSQEAQQPTAMVTFVATNYDPNEGTEEVPVFGVV